MTRTRTAVRGRHVLDDTEPEALVVADVVEVSGPPENDDGGRRGI
jgi:hypothetical protein